MVNQFIIRILYIVFFNLITSVWLVCTYWLFFSTLCVKVADSAQWSGPQGIFFAYYPCNLLAWCSGSDRMCFFITRFSKKRNIFIKILNFSLCSWVHWHFPLGFPFSSALTITPADTHRSTLLRLFSNGFIMYLFVFHVFWRALRDFQLIPYRIISFLCLKALRFPSWRVLKNSDCSLDWETIFELYTWSVPMIMLDCGFSFNPGFPSIPASCRPIRASYTDLTSSFQLFSPQKSIRPGTNSTRCANRVPTPHHGKLLLYRHRMLSLDMGKLPRVQAVVLDFLPIRTLYKGKNDPTGISWCGVRSLASKLRL